MKFKTPNRPKEVDSKAIYNLISGKWELIFYNDQKTPVGNYRIWSELGNLVAEGEYFGEEGDTVKFKGYTDNNELYIEASIDKGIPLSNRFYNCKGTPSSWKTFVNKINNYKDEEVYCIEQSQYVPIIYELHNLDTFREKRWYDQSGNLLKEESLEVREYPLENYQECWLYSALQKGNFVVAKHRFDEYELISKYRDIYDQFVFYLDYTLGRKEITKEVLKSVFDLEPSKYFHYKRINLIALAREIASKYISENQENSLDILDLLFLMYKSHWIDLPLNLFTHHYMQLIGNGKLDEIKWIASGLLDISSCHYKEKPHLLSLLELSVVFAAKFDEHSLAHNDYKYVRQLLYIEKEGLRTAISDFILEMKYYKDYINFLNSISRNYIYDEDSKILIYNTSLEWNGAFYSADLDFYYPELKGKNISSFIVNGDFQIKDSCILNNWDQSYQVKGVLSASRIEIIKTTILVQEELKANRYIYFENITIEPLRSNNTKAEIKGKINTHLFVFCHMQFRHRGGFKDGCIIIGTNAHCIKYIKEKAHHIDNLNQYIVDPNDIYKKLHLDILVNTFEKGENIFKEDYDPDASNKNQTLVKLQPAVGFFINNEPKEVEKIFKSISYSDYKDDELAMWLMFFYEKYLLYEKDKVKYEKKIESTFKSLLKSLKEMQNSQPHWSLVLFVADYMSDKFEQAAEYKKALDLITQFNRGDEAYYVKKVRLLQQLGKDKEIFLAAYIALNHYKTKQLDDIAQSDDYKKYIDIIEKSSIPPKGSKNGYQSYLSKVRTISCFLEEEDKMTVYKGDVFWNGELKVSENTHESTKNYEFGQLVVLGDLYIKGKLDSFQTNIFVQGNIFVDEIYICDMTLECAGSLFVRDRITILSDIHGTEGAVHGNVHTSIFVSDTQDFKIYGSLDKQTICVGLKGYQFDEYKPTVFHPYEGNVYEFTTLDIEHLRSYLNKNNKNNKNKIQ